MKILHVYKDFDPPVQGGMERHMALMCRFQRQWAEVEALTCSRDRQTRVVERDGTRVTEVAEWGRFQRAPMSPTFPYHLKRMKADVVVIHSPNPTAELSYLLVRPSGKLVVRYQSDIVRQRGAMRFYGPVQLRFLRKADMILASSEQYIDSSPVLEKVRWLCRALPLGILAESFSRPDAERITAIRAQYGETFVLFAGRHRYYKGLDILIRAVRDIESPVVIAGEGPETARLEALAAAHGVQVSFPGHLSHDELVNHLHACALVVFPSVARSEAFGIGILEAHACGKAVVSTRLGTGVEAVNVHGETGINVLPADPQALAEGVNELLRDPARREQMGQYARSRVAREFDAEKIARDEFEIYRRLISDV